MVLLTTDDTINGGIAKFCRMLDSYFTFRSKLLFTKSNNASGFQNYERFSVVGKAPLLFLNFIRLFSQVDKFEKVVINDPQCSLLTMFIVFIVKPVKKLDVIFISHGFIFHNNSSSKIKSAYFKLLIKFIFPRMKVISVSMNDSDILKRFNTSSDFEIFHGIEFADRMLDVEKKYKLVCVARDVPHKNIELYVSFCEEINRELGVNSLLVTNTDKFNHCTSFLEIQSGLSDEELKLVLSESEFFVSFSSYEGFGLAALEALGQGCKPLLFKNSSFEKIFYDSPFVLFDELSISSASEKLKEYPGKQAFQALFAKKKNELSMERMVVSYQKVLL